MHKITILTAARAWGGMEIHTVRLADVLARMGHSVTLIDGGGLYQRHFSSTSNINVALHPISEPFPAIRLRAAMEILSNFKGDLCIFPKGCFEQGNWCIDVAAKMLFSKYVTIEHLCSGPFPPKTSSRHLGGLFPGFGLWWYRRRAMRYLNRFFRFKLPDKVFCVSKLIEKELTEIYAFSANKVITVHNGIDTGLYSPSDGFREHSRKVWGIPSDSLVFGCMGRLDVIKGFDVALNAFQAIKARQKDIDTWLVIAGEGPESEALKKKAAELDVADRVKFVGFSSKPWEIYPAFDVFVLPSRNEGMPLALLEAMSCGCWPIATTVGGIPEVIKGDSFGFLVPAEDVESFSKAMTRCVAAPRDLLKQQKTREHILKNFDAKVQYPLLAKMINDVLTF